MKKAIIVGYNGQDGRLLYEFLSRKGYGIIGIGKNKILCNNHVDVDSIDIANTMDVHTLINDFKPDEIYYLAAFHNSSEDKPLDDIELYHNSYSINVFSLLNFLEGMRKGSSGSKLFYAASSHIFGNATCEFQDESTPINPNSIYAITKAAGLFSCRYYRSKYSIFASVGILYNHESPLRNQKFVSKKIIQGAINIKNNTQKSLVLGDLKAEIDWGYAPDYVEAMHKILNCDSSDDFIIATGKKHTVLDFVKTTFEYLGMDWKLYVKEKPSLITRKKTTLIGNPTKLMTMTEWKPSVDFEQMIQMLIEEEIKSHE